MNEQEYITVWEAPEIAKPEFRLYYDNKGNVICYTCDKLEGDYILVDATTFAESRPDIKVVDGKIVKAGSGAVVSKLYPGDQGTMCEKEDISIITADIGQYWELKTKAIG